MKKKAQFMALLLMLVAILPSCSQYADIAQYEGAVVITDCNICEEMLLYHNGKLVQVKLPYLIVKAYYPGDTITAIPPIDKEFLFLNNVSQLK